MPSLLSRCALGAATLLAMSLVAAPAAQATPDVDEARTEVQELGREVEIAAEEYNDVRVQLDTQQARVDAAQTRVSSQAAAIETMQTELAALAVESFKRGGVDPQLAAVLGNPGDHVAGSSALTLMAERRSTSLSALKDAQEELVELEAAAADELDQVEDLEADLAERRTAIEARLAGAEDVLAAAEAEAARIEAARRAAAERATRARQAAEQAAAQAAEQAAAEQAEAEARSSEDAGSGEVATSGEVTTSGAAAPAASSSSSDSDSGSSSGSGAGSEGDGSGPAAQASTGGSGGTVDCAGRSVEAPDARTATVIRFACSQMGKPYQWGASGPGSYDCSGLTAAAWAQVGVSLPHSSKAQAGYGTRVSRSEMRPGDLVFNFSPISHVGIYIGGGRLVAAPSAGDVVKIQSLEYLPFNTAVRL